MRRFHRAMQTQQELESQLDSFDAAQRTQALTALLGQAKAGGKALPEPGIAYNMGVGFTTANLTGWAKDYLADMRRRAETRTRELLQRVNGYLKETALDYEKEVLPLTPKGNATERHICFAYERKAVAVFPDPAKRAAFWKERLGDAPAEGAKLQNLIRAKTMKKGGVGYVQPGKDSFPLMADMNRF